MYTDNTSIDSYSMRHFIFGLHQRLTLSYQFNT